MLDRYDREGYYKIMEIRVLKYFLAVVKEGSITRAAHSLHLTQPTLTRQLQDLEKELNQKLFIRGKHKITLTPEGMFLKNRAAEIVEMVEKQRLNLSLYQMLSVEIFILEQVKQNL